MNDFCKNAGRTQLVAETAPLPGAHAGFLFELALRGLERRLAVVDLSGGQLPDPALRGMPELAQQAHASPLVDGDDCSAAGMMDDLQVRDRAVRQGHALDRQPHHAALEDRAHLERLTFHRPRPPWPGPTSVDTGATTTCRPRGSARG